MMTYLIFNIFGTGAVLAPVQMRQGINTATNSVMAHMRPEILTLPQQVVVISVWNNALQALQKSIDIAPQSEEKEEVREDNLLQGAAKPETPIPPQKAVQISNNAPQNLQQQSTDTTPQSKEKEETRKNTPPQEAPATSQQTVPASNNTPQNLQQQSTDIAPLIKSFDTLREVYKSICWILELYNEIEAKIPTDTGKLFFNGSASLTAGYFSYFLYPHKPEQLSVQFFKSHDRQIFVCCTCVTACISYRFVERLYKFLNYKNKKRKQICCEEETTRVLLEEILKKEQEIIIQIWSLEKDEIDTRTRLRDQDEVSLLRLKQEFLLQKGKIKEKEHAIALHTRLLENDEKNIRKKLDQDENHPFLRLKQEFLLQKQKIKEKERATALQTLLLEDEINTRERLYQDEKNQLLQLDQEFILLQKARITELSKPSQRRWWQLW